MQYCVPAPLLNNPQALGHELLDKRVRLLEIRARERMRLYAQIDFSSETHKLQIFSKAVDIIFVQKDGEIDKGFNIRSSFICLKSSTFFVASCKPWASAVAAMTASAILILTVLRISMAFIATISSTR